MSSDDDVFASEHGRPDLFFPVRKHTGGGVFEAFAVWRLNVVAPAPELDLCITVFLRRLGLVQPLKVTVVSLVQRLVELGLQRGLTRDFEDDLQCVVRAFQHRCESVIEGVPLQFLACWASSTPFGESGTSTHPVNRFSRFHCDSP